MAWHDVWPKQRANVTRRRTPTAESEHRATVRRNKERARSKARAAEQKRERAQRAVRRAENAAIIHRNKAALDK